MGSVVGVLGGCGGAGASTLAAALAAQAGGVLVDLDATGGGIDVLVGVEDVAGARWSAVEVAGGRIDPAQLFAALPRWHGVPVLAADCAPDPGAVDAVLVAAAELGTVVVDLGRGQDVAGSAALAACALVVVVAPADLPAIAAARVAVAAVGDIPVALVVRRGHLAADEVAELVGAPLAGVLPPVKLRAGAAWSPDRLPGSLVRVAAGLVDGLPPGPLGVFFDGSRPEFAAGTAI
jgi:secretion/DNA translocation related CpaE-like protein